MTMRTSDGAQTQTEQDDETTQLARQGLNRTDGCHTRRTGQDNIKTFWINLTCLIDTATPSLFDKTRPRRLGKCLRMLPHSIHLVCDKQFWIRLRTGVIGSLDGESGHKTRVKNEEVVHTQGWGSILPTNQSCQRSSRRHEKSKCMPSRA